MVPSLLPWKSGEVIDKSKSTALPCVPAWGVGWPWIGRQRVGCLWRENSQLCADLQADLPRPWPPSCWSKAGLGRGLSLLAGLRDQPAAAAVETTVQDGTTPAPLPGCSFGASWSPRFVSRPGQLGRPGCLSGPQPGHQGFADQQPSSRFSPQMRCAPGYSPITWR